MYVYLQRRKIKQCKRIKRLFYPLCIQEAKMKQTGLLQMFFRKITLRPMLFKIFSFIF